MKKNMQNDKGFTLIEVFASLILITIILLSFFGLFIQSNKTTKTSSTIIDSTYLAQTEMENVFKEIKGKTEEQLALSLNYKSNGPSQTVACNNKEDIGFSTIWTFEKQQKNVRFELTIKRHCQFELLDSIIIRVYEGAVLKSTVENIYSRK
ncbi:prepilin-type N-terminal cleavage/methylation domain-containing protein [Lysinibacillus xylanilyticus]|uniref:prepilin-type N-terminal cleavage/methylation domain-containing protein n=1 Tax=Lysinibacillus xylanilyticus TaxID=582475 RepID=UPI00382722F9